MVEAIKPPSLNLFESHPKLWQLKENLKSDRKHAVQEVAILILGLGMSFSFYPFFFDYRKISFAKESNYTQEPEIIVKANANGKVVDESERTPENPEKIKKAIHEQCLNFDLALFFPQPNKNCLVSAAIFHEPRKPSVNPDLLEIDVSDPISSNQNCFLSDESSKAIISTVSSSQNLIRSTMILAVAFLTLGLLAGMACLAPRFFKRKITPSVPKKSQFSDMIAGKLKENFKAAEEQALAEKENDSWDTAYESFFKRDPLKKYEIKKINERLGVSWYQGERETFEDLFIEGDFEVGDTRIPVFGVLDGFAGNECARYVKNKFISKLQQKLQGLFQFAKEHRDKLIFKSLEKTMQELSQEFKDSKSESHAGTTANIALLIDQDLWVANTGDSRSILCQTNPLNKFFSLSEDASLEKEKYCQDVIRLGGEVVHKKGKRARIGGKIATGRALGGGKVKGVNPCPTIIKFPLKSGEYLYLSATDGLWGVASSLQVARFVFSNFKKSPENIAKLLVHKGYVARSKDNITVLVARLEI